MALKLDITDSKGVKTRYHRICSVEFNASTIIVKLHSYVNQATRDSEKNAVDQNAKVRAYEDKINALRLEFDGLIGNEDETERTVELSNQINELELDPARPQYSPVVDTHYSEDEVTLPALENFTLDAVYALLTADGRYKDAEAV